MAISGRGKGPLLTCRDEEGDKRMLRSADGFDFLDMSGWGAAATGLPGLGFAIHGEDLGDLKQLVVVRAAAGARRWLAAHVGQRNRILPISFLNPKQI